MVPSLRNLSLGNCNKSLTETGFSVKTMGESKLFLLGLNNMVLGGHIFDRACLHSKSVPLRAIPENGAKRKPLPLSDSGY